MQALPSLPFFVIIMIYRERRDRYTYFINLRFRKTYRNTIVLEIHLYSDDYPTIIISRENVALEKSLPNVDPFLKEIKERGKKERKGIKQKY